MEKIRFEIDTDGFHGVYWKNSSKTNAGIIMMLGDDSEDYLAKSGARWAVKQGINVMTMSPAKKDYGHHNYPLERIATAIQWMKQHGNSKIGIAGASTTGTLALAAASYFPDITLTIAMTPSDFVWEGFMQGNRDGCKEWPVDGESLFSYQGKPLPYMPFVYRHPDYWHIIKKESQECGDMIASRILFDDSEKAHPIQEQEFIKIEKIKGKLLLVGAEDDSLWDTAKYIRRMQERLKVKTHDCDCEVLLYKHGTHFVFPQSLLKTMLPIGSGLMIKAFAAGKKYPKECRQTRMDIDEKVTAAINIWK
jgi:hypothetical protein